MNDGMSGGMGGELGRDADGSPAAARSPEWMRRAERGNMFWLRIMRVLSLGLGRRLSRPILHGIAVYFVLAAGPARRASRDYLRRSLGREPGLRDLYRHVLYFASTIHDRVYLLNDREDLFDITLRDRAALDELHQAGEGGALLLGAHFGSFEVLRSLARRRGDAVQKLAVAMYPENARRINAALGAINPAVVADIVPLGRVDSVLELHRRLGDGDLVALLADRAVGADAHVALPLLGEPAAFPCGPFRLAALLRRPVYFIAGIHHGGKRYELVFERLDADLPPGSREVRAAELQRRYAALLDRECRAAPYNWFNFFDFWKSDAQA